MTAIKEDLQAGAAWIVEYFGSDRILLDYSIDSFRSIDIFFDQRTVNGKTTQDIDQILFSLGAYVGETILRNVQGSVWITEDNDPQGIMSASIRLPNGKTIKPIQKVNDRFQKTPGDAIYAFGATILKEIARDKYWNRVRNSFYNKTKIPGGSKWRFGQNNKLSGSL